MNYIEFGKIKNKKKKIYEKKFGNLYDFYMLSRYYEDIYQISKNRFDKIHDSKDLKFNLINFILLKLNKKKFYEFGYTLFEKIEYFNFFNRKLALKINSLNKIKFVGNDISNKFLFFAENFFCKYKLKLFQKFKEKDLKNSVFFSKGVSLLYEKKNIHYLQKIINLSDCGSFDLSFSRKKKFQRKLETGLTLYYPSFETFKKIIKNSNKKFLFRNIRFKKNLVYVETVFGSKKRISQFIEIFINLGRFMRKNELTKKLKLNEKFIYNL